jgi:hypothetical protein
MLNDLKIKTNHINSPQHNTSIAIFSLSPQFVKDVTYELRKLQLVAHLYDSWDNLFLVLKNEKLDFLVIDSSSLMDANKELFEHVKKEWPLIPDAPVVLFWSEVAKDWPEKDFLLIHPQQGLKSQFGTYLKQYHQLANLKMSLKRTLEQRDQIQERYNEINTKLLKANHFVEQSQNLQLSFQEALNNYQYLVSQNSQSKKITFDFLDIIKVFFSKFSKENSIIVYQLKSQQKKLHFLFCSPEIAHVKSLGDLWPNQNNWDFIANSSLQMAMEKIMDSFDDSNVCVSSIGLKSYEAHYLVFGLNSSPQHQIWWQQASTLMSSIYQDYKHVDKNTFLLNEKLGDLSQANLSELLEELDESYFAARPLKRKYFYLSIQKLHEWLNLHTELRFSWVGFEQELNEKLNLILINKGQYSFWGHDGVLIAASFEYLDEVYRQLKFMTESFKFWKFIYNHDKLINDFNIFKFYSVPASSLLLKNNIEEWSKPKNSIELKSENKSSGSKIDILFN